MQKNKRLLRYVSFFIGLSLLAAFIYRTSVFRPAMNFHEVDPGKFYRSAQLRGYEFEEAVDKYGIKTVINLRGSQPGEWWFDEEKSTLDRLGVRFENIGFSTEHLQTKEDMLTYVNLLKTVPRPILIHCRSGADRTGEATAIYALDYMHLTRPQALEHVSIKYLHLYFLQPAKRIFVNLYQGAEWVEKSYNPCSDGLKAYAKRESNCTN